jgi:hypothetical protein
MPDPPAPVVLVSPWWMIAHAVILGLAIIYVQLSGYVVAPRPVVVEPPATKPDRPPVSDPINPVPEARAVARPDVPGTVRTIRVGDHTIRIRLGEDGTWAVEPREPPKAAEGAPSDE